MTSTKLEPHEIAFLEALSRHEGWGIYTRLLNDAISLTLASFRQPIATPGEVALHNERVGFLKGIEKARSVIPTLLMEYARQNKE